MTVRLTAVVSGRVQGVGFRYWVRRAAQDLGLHGTATNLPDSRVEVVVEGSRDRCQQLLDALSSDRSPGWVGDVAHSWGNAEGLHGFRVR